MSDNDNSLIKFLNCSRRAFFVKLIRTMLKVLYAWTEISPSGDASIAHYHLLCVGNACEYPMFRHLYIVSSHGPVLIIAQCLCGKLECTYS